MLVTSTFLSAIALLSTSATALAVPTESDNTLEARATNSIDVNAACALTHGSSFVAQTTGKGCNDWVCVRGGVRYGIDLNQHCRDTWGSSARSSCPNGVYSWICIH